MTTTAKMTDLDLGATFDLYCGAFGVSGQSAIVAKTAWDFIFRGEEVRDVTKAIERAVGVYGNAKFPPSPAQVSVICDVIRNERTLPVGQQNTKGDRPLTPAERQRHGENMAREAMRIRADIATLVADGRSHEIGNRREWAEFLERCADVYVRNAGHSARGEPLEPRPKIADIFRVLGMNPANLNARRRPDRYADDSRESA